MKRAEFLTTLAILLGGMGGFAEAPKTWNAKALADWATPVAGLNVRPGHFSEEEYYRAPVDNVRTYPVYYPGREPEGYWEMLQNVGPKPLIEPDTLKADADWIRAGKRVFEEYDIPVFRTYDPKSITAVRNPETFAKVSVRPRRDGTLPDLRWVPTSRGLALSETNCGSCHVKSMPDGTQLHGAPKNGPFELVVGLGSSIPPAPSLEHSPQMFFWRAYAVPWIRDDVHESIRTKDSRELFSLFGPAFGSGLVPRWHSSFYYPTKIPDLIGFKDRKYIDHTATHKHRGLGDLMRYSALVSYSDASDFGPHRMLTDEQRKIPSRLPDEALYALALYIYSLEPPLSPQKVDERAAAGQKIFERERCAGCHTPPLYTNNKLTLAVGFTPPKEHFQFLDILPVCVGTDPGLALKTRKGTGYYKVPSLKGLWYRGRYLHDGALTSLKEMFDPARLQDDYVPSGFRPAGAKTRAIKGHEFGLKLLPEERTNLIAFLHTL
jgi:mono/diheme cytochrome c family protein